MMDEKQVEELRLEWMRLNREQCRLPAQCFCVVSKQDAQDACNEYLAALKELEAQNEN